MQTFYSFKSVKLEILETNISAGRVGNVKVLRGVESALDKEAVRRETKNTGMNSTFVSSPFHPFAVI